MSQEARFLKMLQPLARNPAARGFLDDTAVLELDGTTLVITHDMIAENVHFVPTDPPQDVAWKLVTVNLSDLAAKGTRPIGAMMGYSLQNEGDWDQQFVEGLRKALDAFGLALLGGDTVSLPFNAPRCLGLTVFGVATGPVPSRTGARVGDHLWVTGSIGDAHAGLRIARGEREGPTQLLERYRNPRPRMEAGQRLVHIVTAMMDVSDGLLLDGSRMADASGVRAVIELETVPLSDAYLQFAGDDRGARLSAMRAGDDYELLFTASPDAATGILALGEELGIPVSRIGRMEEGSGLHLLDRGTDVPLPPNLGYEH